MKPPVRARWVLPHSVQSAGRMNMYGAIQCFLAVADRRKPMPLQAVYVRYYNRFKDCTIIGFPGRAHPKKRGAGLSSVAGGGAARLVASLMWTSQCRIFRNAELSDQILCGSVFLSRRAMLARNYSQ